MISYGIEFTDKYRKLIDTYIEELLKWNRTVNLIGRSTEEKLLETHIKDSLALYPFLENCICQNIIDIGSGGGIPAVPLSVLLPSKKFYLTERNSKKLAFLEFITKKLHINSCVVDINCGFIFREESVIISRAYSSTANIIKWSKKHAPGCSRFYLLKGREDKLLEETGDADIENFKIVHLEKGSLLIIERHRARSENGMSIMPG